MKRFWILKGLKFALFGIAFVLLGGYIIMHLWNWLIPAVFTGNIGFAQALGILVLMRILVGGFRGHRGHGGWGGHHGGPQHWKARMEQRMANMSPEEREAFKQQMKSRWGKHCGGWNEQPEPTKENE